MRNLAISATRHFASRPAKPREETRLAVILQERDFGWTPAEIAKFRDMWNQGVPMPEIAKLLKRHERDVFLLWFDQYFEEQAINDRGGGYNGNTGTPVRIHTRAQDGRK